MCDVKLLDIDVRLETIKTRLNSLKEDKAAGDDNLSPRVLKAILDEIAYPIAVIFRRSLDTGCVPRDWRTANVTPIYKKGNRRQRATTGQLALQVKYCLLYTSPSPRDRQKSRMPSSA